MVKIKNLNTNNLFKYYNHLGFFNPYFIDYNSDILFSSNISKILDNKTSRNEIDNSSLLSLMSKGYIIGDGTLIKGIGKTSWNTKYEDLRWKSYTQLKFSNIKLDYQKIAKELFFLLKKELKEYIGDKKSVGVLLTGGMDSRIVAGVLDFMLKTGELKNVDIVGITWGNKNSRDVVYANKIASRLNWSWKHYDITPEDFLNNIYETANRGCEFSPNHLHGMIKVSEEKGVDCIIAGSFGDSIGRSEYSGKRVLQLEDIRSDIKNYHGYFKYDFIPKNTNKINQEVLKYWYQFPQSKPFQQIEQDYQIHYMRRMLNPCLSVINEKIPLYQAFTNPKIVQFIWSLDPEIRNDEIYKELLNLFYTDLKDIPWARTGLLFHNNEGTPDNYNKAYHKYFYSNIFNNELFDTIKELVLSENIEQLNVFNMSSLKNTFKIMKTPFYKYNSKLEQKLTWLASLALFVKKYDIVNSESLVSNTNIKDKLNSNLILKDSLVFLLKSYYRKFYLKIEE